MSPTSSPPTPTRVSQVPVSGGVNIPVARGEWATLSGQFPMPRAKWEKFLHMLEEMEFALVEDEGPPDVEA